jgi:hypothetical protein
MGLIVSPLMAKYRQLEEELCKCRRSEEGTICGNEDDRICADMADLWWQLTQEERDILDSERSTYFPDHATKPFKDAEVGLNLFKIDCVNRYIYIAGGEGPRFHIYFLVNAGRKEILSAILPEPTQVFLVQKVLHSLMKMAVSPDRWGVLIPEFYLAFDKPPELDRAQLLEKIKNDPHFFDGG